MLPVIRYRDEIGQAVMHSYEIYNGGPWKVPYLQVVVSWPYQVENGKQIGKWLVVFLVVGDVPRVFETASRKNDRQIIAGVRRGVTQIAAVKNRRPIQQIARWFVFGVQFS